MKKIVALRLIPEEHHTIYLIEEMNCHQKQPLFLNLYPDYLEFEHNFEITSGFAFIFIYNEIDAVDSCPD